MSLASFVAPSALRFSQRPSRWSRTALLARQPTRTFASAAPAAAALALPTPTGAEKPLFQCPTCGTPYDPIPPQKLSELPDLCPECGTPVLQRRGYVDLTRSPRERTSALRSLLTAPRKQSIFQLPTVSYAYERGWRSQFKRAGFPGIDRELALFLDHALPAERVLDLSCGSGLMARRLASSGRFGRVVAADFSDAMLRETVDRARRDVTVPEFDVVRADVAALPFVDAAFNAVHAGAALHCWPNVQDGLSEVRRVLAPGGRFFATTFFQLAYLPFRDVLQDRPRLMQAVKTAEDLIPVELPYRFFEKDELEYLFKAAGFTAVEVEGQRGCAIIRCEKPKV